VSGHKDIPGEVVQRAQDYDRDHWREDRDGERGGSWGSVPADQVRRLLWGAYGGEDEDDAAAARTARASIEAGEAVVPWEQVKADAGPTPGSAR
jgi:hypothetical protein